MNITLYSHFIVHDIDQETFRLAKMRIEDVESRSDASSTDNNTDIPYYRRKILEGIAKVKTILAERLTASSATSGSDSLDTSSSSWVISLIDNEFKSDPNALAEHAHRFVVNDVLASWAVVYAPDAVQSFVTDRESCAVMLKVEANKRKKPVLDVTVGTTDETVNIS